MDVKARDSVGRTYQIEMQMCVTRALPVRLLYTWSQIYKSQVTASEKLDELRPVISIWLLAQPLLPDERAWLHEFGIWDHRRAVRLSDHLQIYVLELSKWQRQAQPLASLERWLYFFNEAKGWTELPSQLDDPIMRQAMSVLSLFSDRERAVLEYESRFLAQLLRNEEEAQRKEDEARRREDEQRRQEDEAKRQEDEQRRQEDEAKRREDVARLLQMQELEERLRALEARLAGT